MKEQVERLSEISKGFFGRGEIIELRRVFLAFTTDTVALHSLGQTLGLQNDGNRAKDWSRTMRAVAQLTPFIKQFPWILSAVQNLPIIAVEAVMPDLARVLRLHEVRPRRPLKRNNSHQILFLITSSRKMTDRACGLK